MYNFQKTALNRHLNAFQRVFLDSSICPNRPFNLSQ